MNENLPDFRLLKCFEVLMAERSVSAAAARLVPQIVSDPDLEAAYGVPGVPFLVVLDGSGIVRSKGTVNSLEQIEGLIDTALRRIDDASQARAS